LRHPVDSARLFFTPHAKQVALVNLFAPWLGLPLLSPLLLVALPTLGERFFSDKPEYWAQGFHYSIVLAPVLAFAAVDTTARLVDAAPRRTSALAPLAIGLGVVLAGAYFSFVRLRPLDELERYTSAGHVAEIRRCLSTIPGDASVAATSALVPHLTHRRRIYVLDRRPTPRTTFIAIDAGTWIFPRTQADLGQLVRRSLGDGYGVECAASRTVVLKLGARRSRLPADLSRVLRLG
jgi:uncharacterized membrane protein